MIDRNRGWARDFFGPLWAWLIIGIGLMVMASACVLSSMGFGYGIALTTLVLGASIALIVLAFLTVLGRRSWQAFFWVFHLDDEDLIMGRKK